MRRSPLLAVAFAVLVSASPTAQPAYLSPGATGGSLDNPAAPFGTFAEALAAGADELRAAAGSYAGDLVPVGAIALRTWNGESGGGLALDVGVGVRVAGRVTIAAGESLHLGGAGNELTVAGDVTVQGELDIGENTLAVEGGSPPTTLRVGPGGDLIASHVSGRARSLPHLGLLRFIGGDDTEVSIETTPGRLRFDFPAIEIDKPEGEVHFDGSGIEPTGGGEQPVDGLGTPSLEIHDLDGDPFNGPTARMGSGLDLFQVTGPTIQLGGEFLMTGPSSNGTTSQLYQTYEEWRLQSGRFLANGGQVRAEGAMTVGDDDPASTDAILEILFGGQLTVVGDFVLQPDGDFRLGFGDATFKGGVTLNGVGDGAGSGVVGIFGDIHFQGNALQRYFQAPGPDTYLDDVLMEGLGGIELQSDGTMNEFGVLTLSLGVIDTSEERFDWIILNPGLEEDLSTRNNGEIGRGVVQLGSRDSYINGGVERTVAVGAGGSGTIQGGYLFPVGTQEDRPTSTPPASDVDFFRPLILQFPDDLRSATTARVDYLSPDERPAIDQTPVTDGAVTLDRIGDAFWRLGFHRTPSFDPNVRVAFESNDVFRGIDGTGGPVGLEDIRIILWDCDGTNPRLAGTYLGDAPGAAMRVAHIDGLSNVSQYGLEVGLCNLLGVAAPSGDPTAEAPDDVPEAVTLGLPVPNPSAGTTEIRYALPGPADVRLVVYDALGREVAVLADGPRAAGPHTVAWDGGGSGRRLAAGAYVIRLDVGAERRTQTVVRIR